MLYILLLLRSLVYRRIAHFCISDMGDMQYLHNNNTTIASTVFHISCSSIRFRCDCVRTYIFIIIIILLENDKIYCILHYLLCFIYDCHYYITIIIIYEYARCMLTWTNINEIQRWIHLKI